MTASGQGFENVGLQQANAAAAEFSTSFDEFVGWHFTRKHKIVKQSLEYVRSIFKFSAMILWSTHKCLMIIAP